jgi:hypothetical protein
MRISPTVFLAALFSPEPQQGLLVLAHDDPGIGAADEVVSGRRSIFFITISKISK